MRNFNVPAFSRCTTVIIRLDNYKLGNKIASLALNEEAFQNLTQKHLNTIYLENKDLFFYPEKQILPLTEKQADMFKQCDSYDVFQINELGQAYKYYDNENGDNVYMLTEACNSNCIMCPATERMRRNKQAAAVDDILQIIRHMPSDAKHITITGGEPFLIGERIFEILAAFKEKCQRTHFLLLTNGRALSYEPFIRKFHETAPNRILVGIPLHGYNSHTHDEITRSPGGFEQTVQGIKNLLNFGHKVEIRIVVSKLNYKNITAICDLISEEFKHVHRVEIMGLEMLGNAAINQADVWIPYKEAFAASREGINTLVNNSIEVGLYNFPLCSVDENYHSLSAKSITSYKVRYADECDRCMIRDACGGIFAGTIRLAKQDIKPVLFK